MSGDRAAAARAARRVQRGRRGRIGRIGRRGRIDGPAARSGAQRRARTGRRPRVQPRRGPGGADPVAVRGAARRPRRDHRRRHRDRGRAPRRARRLHRLRGHRRAHRRCRRPARRRRGGTGGRDVVGARDPRRGRGRARPRRCHLVVSLRRGPHGSAAGREGGPSRGLEQPAHGNRRRRPRGGARAGGGGGQALRRSLGHGDDPAARPHLPDRRSRGRGRRVGLLRVDADPGAPGRAGLGVHRRTRLGLRRRARGPARPAGREGGGAVGGGRDLRPRHRPVQPLAHHPRVGGPRHRARPGPRVRGRLCRHVLRHLRQARDPAVRVAGHARGRGPHHPARPRLGRLRRRRGGRPELRHRPRRRARRLPARSAHGGGERPGPVERVRLRRLAAARPHPAHGERLAAARPGTGAGPDHRGAGVRRRAGHLRGRRQELVHRHAALQLPVHGAAVLPDRGRTPGGAGQRRRLPGPDHRVLGVARGGRWARHLRPRRRLQLRQGPARPGRTGQPRVSHRRCSARSGC